METQRFSETMQDEVKEKSPSESVCVSLFTSQIERNISNYPQIKRFPKPACLGSSSQLPGSRTWELVCDTESVLGGSVYLVSKLAILH